MLGLNLILMLRREPSYDENLQSFAHFIITFNDVSNKCLKTKNARIKNQLFLIQIYLN